MRAGSFASLLLLCAAVALACGVATPATAQTQEECYAQYTCSSYGSTYTLVSLTNGCYCCLVESNEADLGNCHAALMKSSTVSSASASASSSSSSAVVCEVPNCSLCVPGSSTTCATCMDGYELSADSTTCSSGIRSTSTTTPAPSSCDVAHCTSCEATNSSSCAACNDNYYVSNGKCVLSGSCSVANCAQCMLLDGNKCSTCYNGYVQTTTFQCALNEGRNGASAAPHSLVMVVVAVAAVIVAFVA